MARGNGRPKASCACPIGSIPTATSTRPSRSASSAARPGAFSASRPSCPAPNSYRRSSLGAMPVVVTRDQEGALHAFENRCAHRGSLLVLDESGEARNIICVYHNWSYDLAGNLTGVAFRKGLGGKGGMPAECRPETHGPRKLRIETLGGLVFGTLVDGGAAARAISRGRDRRAHPPRDAGAGEAARRLQPGAAEQLEALHGEREGQLPREPAAHVLHHLPPQPPVAERRHRGERFRRPSRQLFARRR